MPKTKKTKAAPHMTFSIPDDVKRRAQSRRDVNWSAVVSRAIGEHLDALELVEKVLATSRLTRADVDEIAGEIDRAIAKRNRIGR
ncbi:MAG TPA: hypothetical protein VGB42_00470 [Candidatus Thermoplasmatota archaeon]